MRVDKILIRGPNWIGDAVLAIPAMKAIRAHFSDAEITLLVRPWVSGLFTSLPFIDKVWSEPRPSRLLDWSRITREIRRRRFDLLGDVPEGPIPMELCGSICLHRRCGLLHVLRINHG